MNYRNILKAYKLERELSDDETALLNTLRGMTEAERELFAETLQPEKVVKAPTKERKIEKCEVCNFTRRAARHQSVIDPNYHEFVKAEKKSSRASSLKEKIQGTVAVKSVGSNSDNSLILCGYEFPGGGTCKRPQDHNIHHLQTDSLYHPFRSAKSQKTNSDEEPDIYDAVAAFRERSCAHTFPDMDGKVCGSTKDSVVHNPRDTDYDHPFAPPSTTAPPATRPSAANGGGESGGQSLETETATVSSAGAGD